MLRRNIKTRRLSNKLDYTKLGPFKIRRQKGPVNYELELLPNMRIHPVFYVSLLELAHLDTPVQNSEVELDPEMSTEYEVEKILDKRIRDGTTQYLVKWKRYLQSDNS